MKRTVLAIGDLMMSPENVESSLYKFIEYRGRLKRRGIDFKLITYDDLILNRLPEIKRQNLKIMLFFPYSYWNSSIERYDKDDRIYGDMDFGGDYKRFFLKVDKIIKRRYKNKNLQFINPPLSCILDRDKKRSHSLFKKAGIATPHVYTVKTISQIEKLLKKGKALYIKPVFGSMGKGITYIDAKGCYTNYNYTNGKVISRPYDYNWKFMKIPNSKRDAFLRKLISKKFLFQEAVEKPMLKRRRFDIRVYVICKKVPYVYAKSAPRAHFLTNWSQGGRIEDRSFLNRAIDRCTLRGIKTIAKKAALLLNLNYAGIDIIVGKEPNSLYLLEVHSFPGYERGFDLMKFLADMI